MYLCAGLEVIIQHVHRDSEVASVEGVGTVPALGAKSAPFCHGGMEIAEGKEDAFELVFPGAHLQGVLQYRQRGRVCKFTLPSGSAALRASQIHQTVDKSELICPVSSFLHNRHIC